MKKNYEVYYFSPDNPQHLEQWLEGILKTTGLHLLAVTGDYWIFEQTSLLDNSPKVGSLAGDAMESYGGFYDKAVVALGFSSASLPSEEMDQMMLKKISDLFWVCIHLADALQQIYQRLPAHWRDFSFSYFELLNKASNVLNGHIKFTENQKK